MAFGIVAAVLIIAIGLFFVTVLPKQRSASAPENWTPNTRRGLGVGIALGGVALLVIVLLL